MRKTLTTLICILCLLLLSSCDYVDKPGDMVNKTGVPDNVEGRDSVDLNTFYQLKFEDDSTDDLQRIWATFIVPVDAAEEDIRTHANNYIKDNMITYPDLQVISIDYFDDVVFSTNHWDEPVALILWAPRGSYTNHHGIPVDDYSTHTIGYLFSTYDEKYELDHAELEVYAALQDYAFEKTGEYLRQRFYTGEYLRQTFYAEYIEEDIAIYESYAEESGISVDRLIEIRIKATRRRLMLTYTQLID